jgi:hypothetical protein
MLLQAKLKCNKDHVPYRIYINDELITERFYTITSKNTVSNDLLIELKDADEYDLRIENLSETPVKLLLFFKYSNNDFDRVNLLRNKYLLGDIEAKHKLMQVHGYTESDLEALKY